MTLLVSSFITSYRVPCLLETQRYPAFPKPTVNFHSSLPVLFILIILTFFSLSTLDNPEDCQDPRLPSFLCSVLRNVTLEEFFGLQVTESLTQSGSNNKMFFLSQEKKCWGSSMVNSILKWPIKDLGSFQLSVLPSLVWLLFPSFFSGLPSQVMERTIYHMFISVLVY